MAQVSRAGFIALGIKLGPKLFKVFSGFLKLAQGAGAGKTGLAAASFTGYSVIFTWQFALLIVGMIFLHEMGHIVAMKRSGMKTKGIYFLPFMGGAAVSGEAFPDRKTEVLVALAGPFIGFLLALFSLGVWAATQDPLWAAVASWAALVNVFNLLPISPLDGGRVFKSIAFSLHSWLGFAAMACGIVAAIFLAVNFGLWLLVLVGFIGALDLASEVFDIRKTHSVNLFLALLQEKGLLLPDDACGPHVIHIILSSKESRLDSKATTLVLKLHGERAYEFFGNDGAVLFSCYNAQKNTGVRALLMKFYDLPWWDPRQLYLSDCFVKEAIPASYTKKQTQGMHGWETLKAAALYAGLIALLLGVMYLVADVPGAQEAFELLV